VVGSTSLLIIRSEVAFPQPVASISIIVLPAGTSGSSRSTGGSGYGEGSDHGWFAPFRTPADLVTAGRYEAAARP
jgi:hypothetical protein